MNKKIIPILILVMGFMLTLNAQDSTKASAKNPIKHGIHFVDKDGDGYNDNAPDHDNDGIPNGLDQDYRRGMRALANYEKKLKNGETTRFGKRWDTRRNFKRIPPCLDSTTVKDSSKLDTNEKN